MRILCIATKPPWPPRDGGRLALLTTVDALVSAGHDVRVVAPRLRAPRSDRDVRSGTAHDSGIAAPRAPIDVVTCESAPRSWARSLLAGVVRGTSASLERHRHPALAALVGEQVATWKPDVIHVEQLQAFTAARSSAAGVPVVLRMQNVESSLLEQALAMRANDSMTGAFGSLARAVASIEAVRVRQDEVAAMCRATRVIALSSFDADVLRRQAQASGHASLHIGALALPFPAKLPAGEPLATSAVPIAIGGSDWWPNADGLRWFSRDVMPLIDDADVHVFGGSTLDLDAHITVHPPPPDSAAAFPRGAIVVVPLRAASGIRMRILEAFARDSAVIATSAAARGLDVTHGTELLIADSPRDFATAIARLQRDAALRASLIANSRSYLRKHHGTAALDALVDCYRSALKR